ncbi:hypothetical protein LPJ66_002096 [Kickxella alabastrina]|uniref:Uncharacterized protein n=1 Tax=Kickxella alabastrina TaxID=61397 RepID=A0ACC1IRC5_9FUNG|nr:hypothetical protein LPJ66_002096 [Kickxella alabastrina]
MDADNSNLPLSPGDMDESEFRLQQLLQQEGNRLQQQQAEASTSTPQHRRHYSRRHHDDHNASTHDADSAGGNSSGSGSISCSTASKYSVDHPEGDRGHRHRHYRRSYAAGEPVKRSASRRMSMQNLPVSQRSTGRRRQVAMEAEFDDSAESESETGRASTNGSTSGSTESEGVLEGDNNVRTRQEALNTRHPFGLPIWKPALYKKSRSVTRAAFLALHATPLRSAKLFLKPGNIAWMLLAGWELLAVCMVIAAIMFVVPCGGRQYARVAAGLGWYLLWPFGRYVERIKDDAHERERCALDTEGASALEAGDADDEDDDEDAPLLGSQTDASDWSCAAVRHARFRKQTMAGRAVFYALLVTVLNPILILVSALSWFAVFSIPMGKLTYTLTRYLWRDPLSLHFRSGDLPTVKVPQPVESHEAAGDASEQLDPQAIVEQPAPTVLLCTNDAVGWYYYKYTVDGVNILIYNMLSVAVFVLVAAFIIAPLTHHQHALVQPGVLFPLCLVSTMPLAYFIGQAVSSISAQSSLGMGAVINATFGSIVEVILYSIALTQGKARLVEGALVGSLLAGLLLMPGTSMIAGGIKHKMQRFNAKSAEVTATLVIMSIIGAFAPTLFYHTFAVPEFECRNEVDSVGAVQRCRQTHVNFLDDPFYLETVRPFMYCCTAILPLAYLIALWFSLKTHVKHIYSSNHTSNPIVRHVLELFRRAIGPDGINLAAQRNVRVRDEQLPLTGDLEAAAEGSVRQHQQPSRISRMPSGYDPANAPSSMPNVPRLSQLPRVLAADPDDQLPDLALLEGVADGVAAGDGHSGHGGHDAPNWSKSKSAFILCACTVAFSLIAEVLVETVDVVIQELGIGEKIIGLTLFSLVPNVTEFMNAIAFAVQNNIALSIEISNAYTVQVALLQIPILVFFSAFYGVPDFVRPLVSGPSSALNGVRELAVRWFTAAATITSGSAEGHLPTEPSAYVFALMFPLWDVIAILFCVFLLTYMLIEGKANYFKGSILCLSYLVWMLSYAFEPIRNVKSD